MKLSKLRKLLIPCLALSLAGCGGGSDNDTNFVGGDFSGGGVTPPPVPNGTSRTFEFPNFPTSGQLTVVGNYQPPDETSATTAQVIAAVDQGPFNSLAKVALGQPSSEAGVAAIAHGACGTADVSTLVSLMGTSDPGVRNQTAPAVRKRYQDLPEGSQQPFALIINSKIITAEKVLAPNETQHCIIFAELDASGEPCVNRDKALQVAQAFDSNNPASPGDGIYNQVRAVFGSEWNQNPVGGNDGDTKVIILFFRSQTLGNNLFGYTSPIDEQPNGGELSNRAEIVYVNADKDLTQTLSTLAHEFQHIINYNEKVVRQGTFPAGAQEENVSVNEGLSQLAEEVCGFDFDYNNTLLVDVCNDYLSRPQEHEFFDFFAAGVGYGQSFLFFKYVREHYGDAMIRSIVVASAVGKPNLDARLPEQFAETFRRWTVANYATNLDGNVPAIYTYPSGFQTDGNYQAGQLVGPQLFSMDNNSDNSTGTLGAWSTAYLNYSQSTGDDLSLVVQTAPNSPVGVVVETVRGTFSSVEQ